MTALGFAAPKSKLKTLEKLFVPDLLIAPCAPTVNVTAAAIIAPVHLFTPRSVYRHDPEE